MEMSMEKKIKKKSKKNLNKNPFECSIPDDTHAGNLYLVLWTTPSANVPSCGWPTVKHNMDTFY